MFSVDSTGSLYGDRKDNDTYPVILPVISLKATAQISNGTGNYNNPYIIE